MAPYLIEPEVLAARLGVSLDTPDGDDLVRLTTAVGDEIRRLTRRALEGDEGGSYDQVLRLHGAREFTLPHVPVQSVTSIARAWFDGTEDAAFLTTEWRLEDAQRGRIQLPCDGIDYVRVVYRTTGEIPSHISQAAADWIAARWAARPLGAGQTGYRTGEDSETWSAEHVGRPPAGVSRALGLSSHMPATVI